ncbi:hypothetical protein GOBAR_AA38924 [Gossypium barbadense]|uniref:CRM domain-containing protein n=1 Tax=Gossypium barbadense TaxID=3634 RepID=A0A2P5VSG3_GOSBA|nr:hypothetical protein GOBAR_AA38924 [Gossypium barbadense]
MAAIASIRQISGQFTFSIKSESLLRFCCFVQNEPCHDCITFASQRSYSAEACLIEKLRKYEVPKAPAEAYDPEILTEEEIHYLKRTGEKKKNYVQVGRRGVFGGFVLNMHLHWKKHETVKVICKPCKPGKVYEHADELGRLSKGIVIDIKPNNTIIFYRGKNYVQPNIMSPADTLSKNFGYLFIAMEKYKYEQSLDHTSEFIEKLEKELEEYLEHKAWYHKAKESEPQDFAVSILQHQLQNNCHISVSRKRPYE